MAYRRDVASARRTVTTIMQRLALLAVTCFPLTACGLSWPAVTRQVLEEGSQKPIPGAIVLVRWHGYVPAPGHAQQVCALVMSATTDDHGRYYLDGWSKASNMGPVLGLHTLVVPYKAGYEYAAHLSQQRGTEYLARATGTEDDRAAFLLRVLGNSGCDTQDSTERNRLPLLRAL